MRGDGTVKICKHQTGVLIGMQTVIYILGLMKRSGMCFTKTGASASLLSCALVSLYRIAAWHLYNYKAHATCFIQMLLLLVQISNETERHVWMADATLAQGRANIKFPQLSCLFWLSNMSGLESFNSENADSSFYAISCICNCINSVFAVSRQGHTFFLVETSRYRGLIKADYKLMCEDKSLKELDETHFE